MDFQRVIYSRMKEDGTLSFNTNIDPITNQTIKFKLTFLSRTSQSMSDQKIRYIKTDGINKL